MPINQSFIAELEHEAVGTRKLLERVPIEKNDWKPHEKSMTLGRLSSHVAELIGWTTTTLETNELDFSKMEYKPIIAANTEELLGIFEENYGKAMKTLNSSNDERFMENWTLRNGEQVYLTQPKVVVVRNFAFNHLYHHRGQLTVYLRQLNVPLPGLFGPTADEPM